MAVPAHDTRDYEFARQFDLPIVAVVDPGERPDSDRPGVLAGKACFVGEGTAVHSGPYDGLTTSQFKQRVTDDLSAQGLGRPATNYKLRDWLFSRQRFWGEPFPILHELDADRSADRAAACGSHRGFARRSPAPGGVPTAWPTRAAPGRRSRVVAVRIAGRAALQARDQHDAAVGRIVLVLPPLY